MRRARANAGALAVALLGLSASWTTAAPQTAPTFQRAACVPHKTLTALLSIQYGETPLFRGTTPEGSVTMLFVSAARTWTIVAARPDGLSCIVDYGIALDIVPRPDKRQDASAAE